MVEVAGVCGFGAESFVSLDGLALLSSSMEVGPSERKGLRWFSMSAEVAFVDVLHYAGKLLRSGAEPFYVISLLFSSRLFYLRLQDTIIHQKCCSPLFAELLQIMVSVNFIFS